MITSDPEVVESVDISSNEVQNAEDQCIAPEPKVDETPKVEGKPEQELQLERKHSDPLPSMGILPPDESSVPGATGSPKSSPPVKPNDVLHKIKLIKWNDIEVPILTQNINGPCPLMAILNALLLKGNITLPKDKKEFSGDELVSILGNAVFDVPRSSVPSEMHSQLEQNTNDAVTILHKLLTGLDVNVKFSGVRDFEFTPELSVFDVLGVSLYHGWVADPDWEGASLVRDLSYNQLTNNIIIWGEEVMDKRDDDLYLKVMLGQEFLTNSVSQLTIYGLFELGATLKDEEIAVLFRNNHFSTIYKKQGLLYVLLTDQGFLHEKAVWETLSDVDATFSTFVTEAFQTIEPTPEEGEAQMSAEQQIDSDQQLAAMLQAEAEKEKSREEDFQKVVDDLGLKALSDEEMARALQNREEELARESQTTERPSGQENQSNVKKKKDCVIL